MLNIVKFDIDECENFSNDIDRKGEIHTTLAIKQERVKEEAREHKDLNSSIVHVNERVEVETKYIKVEPEFNTFSHNEISEAKQGFSRIIEFVEVQYMKEEDTKEYNNIKNTCDPFKLNVGKANSKAKHK